MSHIHQVVAGSLTKSLHMSDVMSYVTWHQVSASCSTNCLSLSSRSLFRSSDVSGAQDCYQVTGHWSLPKHSIMGLQLRGLGRGINLPCLRKPKIFPFWLVFTFPCEPGRSVPLLRPRPADHLQWGGGRGDPGCWLLYCRGPRPSTSRPGSGPGPGRSSLRWGTSPSDRYCTSAWQMSFFRMNEYPNIFVASNLTNICTNEYIHQ